MLHTCLLIRLAAYTCIGKQRCGRLSRQQMHYRLVMWCSPVAPPHSAAVQSSADALQPETQPTYSQPTYKHMKFTMIAMVN